MDWQLQLHHIYRHYKDKYYYVEGTVKHSETQETMVIYRALYDNHERWVRPLNMFLEELPIETQQRYGQKHRFVLWT